MKSTLQILEQKTFSSLDEILRLDFIDFGRLGAVQQEVDTVLEGLSGWLIGNAAYTIVQHDLRHAPLRSDWPNWHHPGSNHESLGRLFWNDFHTHFQGHLTFADGPDFCGTMHVNYPRPVQFWGDIGQVSLRGFVFALARMQEHDLWITIHDEQRQIVLEALIDFSQIWGDWFSHHLLSPSPMGLQPEQQKRRKQRHEQSF